MNHQSSYGLTWIESLISEHVNTINGRPAEVFLRGNGERKKCFERHQTEEKNNIKIVNQNVRLCPTNPKKRNQRNIMFAFRSKIDASIWLGSALFHHCQVTKSYSNDTSMCLRFFFFQMCPAAAATTHTCFSVYVFCPCQDA